MTKFFEVASVSATHIYHSALELSPLSSVVRRLYHHKRIAPSPRVVIGTPDSWNPSVAISHKRRIYRSCTWSPCGQFIAARTKKIVEVLDPLTSELLSTFRPTEPTEFTFDLIGPLAYSPDGRSLCGVSHTAIIIWDIQTGGVVKEIKCGGDLCDLRSVMWSLDGSTIGIIFGTRETILGRRELHTWAVIVYDVTSGKVLGDKFCSVDVPYLWAHDKTFRVMTTAQDYDNLEAIVFYPSEARTVNIFEVGPVLTQVTSFPVPAKRNFRIKSFSPVSHHISVSVAVGGGRLLVLDDRGSVRLSDQEGTSGSHCFSSDGNLFASSSHRGLRVWKYTRDIDPDYSPWREFPFYPDQSSDNLCLRFSPTSSSILGQVRGVLQVWRLDDLPTAPVADHEQFTIFSPKGVYIVNANRWEGIVTITNLLSQAPPQVIDIAAPILGLALTGNILWVVDLEAIVAWRLTEEGLVDGVSSNRRAGRGDSIQTISSMASIISPEFSVEGQTGFIALNGIFVHAYHAGTGERVDHITEFLLPPSRWYDLEDTSRGRYHLHCGESIWDEDLEDISGGWVGDSEVKRRLWIPFEWRMKDEAGWFHDIATVQLELSEGLVIIRF